MTVNISSDEFSAICDAVAAFGNLLESCKEQDDAKPGMITVQPEMRAEVSEDGKTVTVRRMRYA